MFSRIKAMLQQGLQVLRDRGLRVFLAKVYQRVWRSSITKTTQNADFSRGLLTEAQEIAFGGERVTHLIPNDLYYAHLSIYWFASQYVQDKNVLDAGCGDGYGTHYLAEHGAKRILGVDVSQIAINACQKYYVRDNLSYRVMDLARITGLEKNSVDLIFSSNALEHVPSVRNFFDSCHQLLTPDGLVIIAVPPVVDEPSRNANISNPYHLNIWTPSQWKFALSLFFDEIQCYTHTPNKEGVQLNFGNTPEQTMIKESDFEFRQVDLDDFYKRPSLTIIFLARTPKPKSMIRDRSNEMPMIDDSFSRELSL